MMPRLIRRLRRRLLTRCAECGGWSTKRNPVNHSTDGHYGPDEPWWHGEPNTCHYECSRLVFERKDRMSRQLRGDKHFETARALQAIAKSIETGKAPDDLPGWILGVADHHMYEFRKIHKEG